MPHRPKKVKKADTKSAGTPRQDQIADRKRVEAATRSTLARFQNRKSEKK